jgi:drug/metabolite transporter (DMT)-like permease
VGVCRRWRRLIEIRRRKLNPRDLAVLSVAVLGASSAPPLMAAIAAPALAIAFWRNVLALPVAVPLALRQGRGRGPAMKPGILALIVGAAAMLGAHFTCMASALDRTSVASAATLVCSQSVWAALFSRFLGERLSALGWAGTVVALAGVVVVTGADASIGRESVIGNMLALAAGAAGGAYMVAGGVVRRQVSTSQYTALCYGTCAAGLLAVLVATGQPVGGYPAKAWVQLVALTVLAQLVGHSLFNFVMRSISASFVSLAQLLTVPLAILIAAVALGEPPRTAVLPGAALMLLGIGIVLMSHRQGPRDTSEPELS